MNFSPCIGGVFLALQICRAGTFHLGVERNDVKGAVGVTQVIYGVRTDDIIHSTSHKTSAYHTPYIHKIIEGRILFVNKFTSNQIANLELCDGF